MSAVDSKSQFGSPLCPYDGRHRRSFNFSEFSSLGNSFVSAFAAGFIKYSSTIALDTVHGAFSTARHFLRWVIANQQNLSHLVSALRRDHTEISAADWENAINVWRGELIAAEKPGPVRKYNLINGLQTLFNKMAVFGVVPRLYFPYAPQHLRDAGRPTKTLAEVHTGHASEALAGILKDCLPTETELGIEQQVQNDFITSLVYMTGTLPETPQERAQAIMKNNADLLAKIRRCAESDFITWRDHWSNGQHLLASCDLSFEEMSEIFNKTTGGHKRAVSDLLPAEQSELSLSRLLKFFVEHPECRGRIAGHAHGSFVGRFGNYITSFGGMDNLQAYLFPHGALTASAITLALCDTGANVSVALSLKEDCLQKSKDPSTRIISGNKMRAGGKLIVNELPVKDNSHEVSCVEALSVYRQVSEALRSIAPTETSKSLFLYVGHTGEVKTVGSLRWNRWFKEFLKRHPELRALPIRSKFIRPSVLMQAAYDKETGIIAASAIGDHASLATTASYAGKFPTHALWEKMIRDFQSLFQAATIYNIDEAAEKLKVPPAELERLFNEACRTGLGIVCLDPKAGTQPGSVVGEHCTKLENCHDCPQSFVVATVEHLKDLILWNRHLQAARPQWETERPERWGKYWLPWLVFTEVIMEQASRGRTAREFRSAKALADELITSGGVNLPPLW